MSELGRALPPVITVGAIAVAFGVMMFLTVRYSPDCRSPHRSITLGGVVVLAGCGARDERRATCPSRRRAAQSCTVHPHASPLLVGRIPGFLFVCDKCGREWRDVNGPLVLGLPEESPGTAGGARHEPGGVRAADRAGVCGRVPGRGHLSRNPDRRPRCFLVLLLSGDVVTPVARSHDPPIELRPNDLAPRPAARWTDDFPTSRIETGCAGAASLSTYVKDELYD
jgi:hypothetical protein